MKISKLLPFLNRNRVSVLIMLVVISLGVLSAAITPKTYSSEAIVYLRLNNKAILDLQSQQSNAKVDTSVLLRINSFTKSKMGTYIHLIYFGDEIQGRLSQKMGQKLIPGTNYYLRIYASNLWKFTAFGESATESAKLANLLVDELIATVEKLEKLNFGKNYQATIGSIKIQDAVPASHPIAPVPLRNVFLSVVLGSLLIFLRQKYISTSSKFLRSSEDVTSATGLRCIGILPLGSRVVHVSEDGALAHSTHSSNFVNQIRTTLLFHNQNQSAQVFLFVAALPDQGTSFATTQIANSIADLGKSVCLFHANFHSEKLQHSIPEQFLMDVSNFKLKLRESDVQMTPERKSSVTHAVVSTWGNAPSEFFLKGEFLDLLHQMRSQFDYVLIDGPPLLSVSDSAVLAKYSNSTIFIAKSNNVTELQTRNALQGLSGVGIVPQGFILNAIPIAELNIDGKFKSVEMSSSTSIGY